MGNLGMMEILVVAVVALLVFGPERLPELARNAGKAIAKFRTESAKSVEQLRRAADLGELERDVRGVVDDVKGLRTNVMEQLSPSPASTATRDPAAVPPIDPEAT